MSALIKLCALALKLTLALLLCALFYALWFNLTVDTSEYNYPRFSGLQYDYTAFNGPVVGERMAEFSLNDSQGNALSLDSYQGQILVLETGSLTCPPFISRIPQMNILANEYPDVAFVTLYVREAHPGSQLDHLDSLDKKRQRAASLERLEHDSRPVLVDTLSGDLHRSLGLFPNMVYVVDAEGVVVFRGLWNDPAVISKVLSRLESGVSLQGLESGTLPGSPGTLRRVLSRAGGYATTDMLAGMLPSVVGYLRKTFDNPSE